MYVATAAPTPMTTEASSAVGRETLPPRTRSPAASATFPTAASVTMEWAYRHASDTKPRGSAPGDRLAEQTFVVTADGSVTDTSPLG